MLLRGVVRERHPNGRVGGDGDHLWIEDQRVTRPGPDRDLEVGEGGPFHLRLIAAEATWGSTSHAVYAMIDAPDDAAFAAMAPGMMDIIAGAQLPLGVSQ